MANPEKVYHHGARAVSRLHVLGLQNEELLRRAVQRGIAERFSCTDNDASYFKGIVGQARIVRYLRDEYAPYHFKAKNPKGYALTVSAAEDILIAVSSGDEATGNKDLNPKTKTDKGPATKEAVQVNRDQLVLFHFPPSRLRPIPQLDTRALTWILLFHVDYSNREVRCELSYPAGMDADDYVVEWEERILLRPISFDDCRINQKADGSTASGASEEIDVRVQKRIQQ